MCEGFSCFPVIRANLIHKNRKTGIKLANSARAHIGGDDIKYLGTKRLDEKVGTPEEWYEEFETLYVSLFPDSIGNGA